MSLLSSKNIWEVVTETGPGLLKNNYFYDASELECEHILDHKSADFFKAQFQAAVDGENLPYIIIKNILYVINPKQEKKYGVFYIFNIELSGDALEKAGLLNGVKRSVYLLQLLFKRTRENPRAYKLFGVCSDDLENSKNRIAPVLKLLVKDPSLALKFIIYKLKENYPTETHLKASANKKK